MKKRFSRKERKIIQSFVDLIDNDITIKQGKRFETDVENKIIYLGYKNYTYQDEFFENWYQKQEFYIPIYDKLITILHEIGHTQCDTIELEEQRALLDGAYHFIYEQGQITLEELNNAYFEIPAETNATKWGVNFYKSNIELCEKLAEMVGLKS